MSGSSPESDKDTDKANDKDKDMEEMTKGVEMVDIGGDEFSLEVLTQQFKQCQEVSEEVSI